MMYVDYQSNLYVLPSFSYSADMSSPGNMEAGLKYFVSIMFLFVFSNFLKLISILHKTKSFEYIGTINERRRKIIV